MATTTNYSWSTPDDTSLVKDGAAAIRTLGSSIDTTTKALNPATTLGDIQYRSSTANTNTRLGIGTTGQVLTVSGGVPTWATPAAGGPTLVGCALKRTTDASIADSTWTTITYDSEVYDTDAFHSTTTNTSRITIPTGKGGKYQVFANIIFSGNTTGNRSVSLLVNGAETFRAYGTRPDATSASNYLLQTTDTFNAGDYLEIRIFQGSGGSLTALFNGYYNYFGVNYLGA